jgi:hypothetical protein
MARLYADEDVPRPLVEQLRSRGHDLLTVLEARQANQSIPDADVLAYATQLGRSVLTHNRRHFQRLHLASKAHAGIVSCKRDDADPAALADRIHAALAANSDIAGRLLSVTKASWRIEPP